VYAHYRNFHGDKGLLILLSTSLTLYNPILPKNKKNAPGQVEGKIYWNLARQLCKEDNREGIWIGLCLSGITPRAIQKLEFINKTTVKWSKWGKDTETHIARWLYDACESIEQWRRSHRTILRGISNHETTPRSLNSIASHHNT
jgi:hypothetical protein